MNYPPRIRSCQLTRLGRTHVTAYSTLAGLLLILPLTAESGGTVTNCTEVDLRAALEGGGKVTIACDGIITLGTPIMVLTNTLLDATGQTVTINGSNAVRCFHVGTNVTFKLVNLRVANGLGTNGGALFNAGGTVVASNCVFTGNCAVGLAGSGVGQNGAPGSGGAVYSAGSFSASQCAFLDNRVLGGHGTDGSSVAYEIPPPAGSGASGSGGALCNVGIMTLECCLVASNSAAGGNGGTGSAGDYYISPWARGATPGGRGGDGRGGALHNMGVATLINCTFAWNQGNGGGGGRGGTMNGPAPYVVFGPSGGDGGDGTGGIYSTNGLLSVTNCTAAWNSGYGGNGGTGGSCNLQGRGGLGGGGTGGYAIELPPAITINCLLASNRGIGGQGGFGIVNSDKYHPIYGYGPTGYSNGSLRGALNDLGHNLSSDDSAGITNPTSLRNLDARVAPLANTGGRFESVALLAGSPAIDAGDDAAALDSDQRGFRRPIGSACDIGSFECGSPALLTLGRNASNTFDLFVTGRRGDAFRLLAGGSFDVWVPIVTNQVATNGVTLVHLEDNSSWRFYRVELP